MNSLHSIPREKMNPFGLSDDQIKMIRAYKRIFESGIAIWVKDGKTVDVGWDNRDRHDTFEQPDFIKWDSLNWLNIFNSERHTYPEFDPAWIVEVIHE